MGTTKYITEKASTNVPICNSCLKSLESGIRIPYKKRFVITGLIWLGILLLTIIFKAPIVSAIALSLGFGIVPAIFLYYFIRPGGRIKWPVRFQSQNIFSFENETYAKRFASVNGPNAEVY